MDSEPRFFWWSSDELTYPWRLAMLGGDEYARRTVGVRLPGGMLFAALWRFRGAVGPCPLCGGWDFPEYWAGGYCGNCVALGDAPQPRSM